MILQNGGHNRPQPTPWKHRMCGDMCGDIGTCCYGLFCTPCLYGRNYAEFHDVGCCGACCLYCWCWCLSCCFATDLRRSIRNKYNLAPDPCNDLIVHLFCSPCGLCQESREMRYRREQGTFATVLNQ
ncbi:hypothetical protein CHLRE_09g408800v5 [Chlamydomonas reinhardtii]|uniref:Uncharacterized protein n=1 Tax=Chlamydomonas reinhardtii TaxID=3055 RepID=A0A2K3DFG0_CHLRE|nr:uncharacterized protein CHLRE_09g408800v5 [Chlamydomonas reinhardtii]PNW79274.1 hypothetical protein CHLRE_09g408800v5 [Chlamydomonas reinhardtii]